MKSKILTITTLFIALTTYFSASAQESNKLQKSVELTAKHTDQSIVLRWAPISEEWWLEGMIHGYKISRKDMNDPEMKYVTLVDTLLPWTPERIEAYYNEHREDEELAVVMKTMYQDWEDTYYNGGGFLEAMEKNQMLKQRYNMTLLASDLYKAVAEASGLRWEDESVGKDKLYSYKVTLNSPKSSSASYYIAKKWQVLDRPIISEAIEQEESVKITWERELHEKEYTAFYIEKSKDGENFTRLNDKPFINTLAEDEGYIHNMIYTDYVDNYEQHYYRLIGIDPFGDESAPSEPVLAQGRDRTPPEIEKLTITPSESGNANMISWSHEPMKEVKKAILYKMDADDDPKVLYESTDTNYDFDIPDEEMIEGMTDYYLVLVDTAGNIGRSPKASHYIPDNTPPKPPINIQSQVDTAGTVTLTWDQGPDRDIIGYYLYTADKKNDNYIKLNSRKHVFRQYIDTINTSLLTPKRFYKIAAVDKAGNIGKYSEIIEVDRPDKIPPSPCLFYDYKVDSAGIFLGLLPSSSIDVVKHNLYRSEGNSDNWKLLVSFDKEVPQVYLDDKVKSSQFYTYRWVAEDEAGLESSDEHSKLYLQAMDTRIYFRPSLRLKQVKDGIEVEVGNNIPGDNYRIQLVRSVNNGKFRTLTTLSQGNKYIDQSKSQNSMSLKYRARILYKDGIRSRFGNEESISINKK